MRPRVLVTEILCACRNVKGKAAAGLEAGGAGGQGGRKGGRSPQDEKEKEEEDALDAASLLSTLKANGDSGPRCGSKVGRKALTNKHTKGSAAGRGAQEPRSVAGKYGRNGENAKSGMVGVESGDVDKGGQDDGAGVGQSGSMELLLMAAAALQALANE